MQPHACAQVSMIDGELLDTLEAVARHVRASKAPFGGLQLVLTGDFHQLPPVAKGRHATACEPLMLPITLLVESCVKPSAAEQCWSPGQGMHHESARKLLERSCPC